MSFLELVKERKSCRHYSSRAVERDALARCLEAARLAPSACNSQPWKFIVLYNKEEKERVAEVAFSGIHSLNAFAKNAPVLVVVVREKTTYAVKVGGALRGVEYSLIDMGIACEHFILQAAEESLGTCWIGWFNENAVKKELGLPDSAKIDVMISVGYPEEIKDQEKIRKRLDEICEFR